MCLLCSSHHPYLCHSRSLTTFCHYHVTYYSAAHTACPHLPHLSYPPISHTHLLLAYTS